MKKLSAFRVLIYFFILISFITVFSCFFVLNKAKAVAIDRINQEIETNIIANEKLGLIHRHPISAYIYAIRNRYRYKDNILPISPYYDFSPLYEEGIINKELLSLESSTKFLIESDFVKAFKKYKLKTFLYLHSDNNSYFDGDNLILRALNDMCDLKKITVYETWGVYIFDNCEY